MFSIPRDTFDIVDGEVNAILKDENIREIVPRQAINWREERFGDETMVKLWTNGSKSTAGYHIAFMVKKVTIHGTDYYCAHGIYVDGERGKPFKQRLGFLKAVLNGKGKYSVTL